MFPRIAYHSKHGSLNTSKRRQSLWCLPIAHSLLGLHERSFWRKCVIAMAENRTVTMLLVFILFHLDFSRAFLYSFHAFLYTFVVRFYTLLKCVFIVNLLMRFHKTAIRPPRHIELGTVSLSMCYRCIDLYIPAWRCSWFSKLNFHFFYINRLLDYSFSWVRQNIHNMSQITSNF